MESLASIIALLADDAELPASSTIICWSGA
jgi:hypothetical protein